MALRDWERLGHPPGTQPPEEIYRNKKNLKVITIDVVERGSSFWEQYHKKYFVSNNWNFDKGFLKTKKQAVRFAKQWMRKY